MKLQRACHCFLSLGLSWILRKDFIKSLIESIEMLLPSWATIQFTSPLFQLINCHLCYTFPARCPSPMYICTSGALHFQEKDRNWLDWPWSKTVVITLTVAQTSFCQSHRSALICKLAELGKLQNFAGPSLVNGLSTHPSWSVRHNFKPNQTNSLSVRHTILTAL